MEKGTFIACLTPPGKGAIATLAVRGPRAWEITRELFQFANPARDLPSEPETGKFWLGRLGETTRGGSDEVVLAVRWGGENPRLEIHCHGGPEVVRYLLEIFSTRGITICSWQELESRDTTDPIQALAREALTRAPSVRTAAILLDQYHGALTRTLEEICGQLREGRTTIAENGLKALAGRIPLGSRLTQPWRVVIAGPPNVGKSSLVNTLAGYHRSVVSAMPGTTRDVVTTTLAIDGWPVELADTAGWRDPGSSLEREGMARARAAVAQADFCLWILDASETPVFPEAFVSGPKIGLVINKVDLTPAWNLSEVKEAVRVSARTGEGLDNLCQFLARALVPEPPPPEAAVPFSPSLCRRIEQAYRFCSESKPKEALELLEYSEKIY